MVGQAAISTNVAALMTGVGGGGTAPTLIATASVPSLGSASTTVAFSAGASTGFICFAAWLSTNRSITIVTDTKGNTYTKQQGFHQTGEIEIWTAPITTPVTTSDHISLTFDASNGSLSLIAANVASSGVLANATPVTAVSTTASVSLTFTPTAGTIIGVSSNNFGAETPSGVTNLISFDGAFTLGMYYKLNVAASPQSFGITIGGSASLGVTEIAFS